MERILYFIRFALPACGFLLLTSRLNAQQLKLGTNPTYIEQSALLQLDSKNQGLLLTRVPDTSVTSVIYSLNPPDGMIIYFTDSVSTAEPYGPDAGIYQRREGGWERLMPADSVGIYSLNGYTDRIQTLVVGSDGTDFNISDAAGVHTFNLPDASPSARGVVNTGTQSFNGTKTFENSPVIEPLTPGSVVFIGTDRSLSEKNANLFWDNSHNRLGVGTNTPSNTVEVNSGTSGVSGLTFTQMNSASSITPSGTGLIGVDGSGNVVRAKVQRSFSYPTRSLNTAYQVSVTQDAFVTYSVEMSFSLAILTSPGGTVTLEISPDKINWTTVSTAEFAISVLGLLTVNNLVDTKVISGWVPKGYWVQLVSSTTSSAVTVSYVSGQEVTTE